MNMAADSSEVGRVEHSRKDARCAIPATEETVGERYPSRAAVRRAAQAQANQQPARPMSRRERRLAEQAAALASCMEETGEHALSLERDEELVDTAERWVVAEPVVAASAPGEAPVLTADTESCADTGFIEETIKEYPRRADRTGARRPPTALDLPQWSMAADQTMTFDAAMVANVLAAEVSVATLDEAAASAPVHVAGRGGVTAVPGMVTHGEAPVIEPLRVREPAAMWSPINGEAMPSRREARRINAARASMPVAGPAGRPTPAKRPAGRSGKREPLVRRKHWVPQFGLLSGVVAVTICLPLIGAHPPGGPDGASATVDDQSFTTGVALLSQAAPVSMQPPSDLAASTDLASYLLADRVSRAESDRLQMPDGANKSDGTADVFGALDFPLKGNLHVTSPYGDRTNPATGVYGIHQGVDFRAACMTPVYAAGSGTVESAKLNGGHGNQVVLNHGTIQGHTVETVYNHFSAGTFAVKEGDTVQAGQLIGKAGTTGSSTACHLHFEVIIDGEHVDPLNVLPVFVDNPSREGDGSE